MNADLVQGLDFQHKAQKIVMKSFQTFLQSTEKIIILKYQNSVFFTLTKF